MSAVGMRFALNVEAIRSRKMNNEKWFHLLPKKYQDLCPGHPMSHNKIACSVVFFSRKRLASRPPRSKSRGKGK